MLSHPRAPAARRARGPALLVLTLLVGFGLSLVALLFSPPNAAFIAGGSLTGSKHFGDDFPKQLVDPLGRDLSLRQPPLRIASAVLATDEMIAELIDPERLVSVTPFVDDAGISNVAGQYPDSIARNPADAEQLLALEPDLVLLSTHSNPMVIRLLLRSGVPVARFSAFDSFEGVAENLRTLGELLGAEDRADQAIQRLWQRLNLVAERVSNAPRPRVLYYSPSGMTGGPGSLIDEMITRAGGHNVIRDTGIRGHRRISPELAFSLQPEVILISDWSSTERQLATQLLEDAAWAQVPAVRDARVYPLHGAWVTTGSQFSALGVEAIARRLHPQAFEGLAPLDASPDGPQGVILDSMHKDRQQDLAGNPNEGPSA